MLWMFCWGIEPACLNSWKRSKGGKSSLRRSTFPGGKSCCTIPTRKFGTAPPHCSNKMMS